MIPVNSTYAPLQALVDELARDGLAVLMISSDLEELVEGSSRVVVLRDGRSVAELRGEEVTQGRIMRAMAGDAPGPARTDGPSEATRPAPGRGEGLAS